MVTRRVRAVAAATATLAAVAAVAVAATLADGRTASQTETHDGGAWLLNRDAGAIGHVNRIAQEVTGTIRVSDLQTGFDVDQARDVVLVHDRSTSTATLIDDSTYSRSTEMTADDDLTLRAVDGGLIAFDHDPVSARRISLEDMGQDTSIEDLPATLAGEAAGIGTVSFSGQAVIVDNEGTLIREVADADGDAADPGRVERTDLDGLSARPAQITAVGDTIVVLSEQGELLVIDEDVRELELPDHLQAGDWTLQQPSGPATTVTAVTPDGEVVTIGLSDSERTDVVDLDGGLPLEPIVHDGCIYGVATQPPVFTRACGEDVRRRSLADDGRSTGELRLRLVNGWVWVNDVDNGTAWVTDADSDIVRIDDWTAALALNEGDPAEEIATDGPADERRENPDEAEVIGELDQLDLDGPNEPPEARPDVAATREGRAVLVDVLANDTDPNGDVLLISGVDNRSTDDAVVTTTGDGTAIQVVPAVGYTGTVRFSYTVTDGRGGSDSAEVTVDVTPRDPDRNRAPTPTTDVATVRAGERVTLNVLTNDTDPDGDSLHLLEVTGEDAGIQYTSDGTVTLTPEPDQEGRLEFEYVVADEFAATATGRILVEVRLPDSNRPPQARNDAGQTVTGNRIVLDVLANDHDPDGDRLIVQAQPELLAGPAGADPFVALDAQGRLDVEAEVAGTYVYLYGISDGSLTDQALIRIEVADGRENRPPVAVRDDVTIPVGSTRIVPVLRNDIDPDGDVVSIVDWTGAEGLVIEEVEGDRFRVTALDTAAPLTTFRYSISDGTNDPVNAIVSVLRVDPESAPPSPVAEEDEVEVRAGQVTTVPVLSNDHDPSGGPLRVVAVTDATDASATITSDEQQVRLEVPATTTSGFTVGYEIENDHGDRASSTVRVRIVPADEPNRSPVAATDIARTAAGRAVVIDVVGNDRDPDGDLLQLEGIARQPANGTAEVLEDGRVSYTPDESFAGTDRFAYTIADPQGLRAIGEVLVGVSPPWPENRPPQAQDDLGEAVAGGGSLPVDVLGNDLDPDGDPLTVVSVGEVRLGRVQQAADGGSVVYTPPDAVEEDTEVAFRYVVDDGRGGQDDAIVTVTVTVDPEALPPVAVDDRIGPVAPDEVATVDVLANDRAPGGSVDDLAISVEDPALQVVDRQVQVTAPEATRSYLYTLTNPAGLTASGTITVLVQENRPPVVEPAETETEHATPIEIDLTDQATDPDDDVLIYVCCDTVRNGSTQVLSPDAESLIVRFEPDDGFDGRAGFSYTVDDQQGHQVAGSVTIDVAPPSSVPPVASDGDFEVEAGGTRSVDLGALVEHPGSPDDLTYVLGDPSGPITIERSGTTLRIAASVDAAGSTGQLTYTVRNDAGDEDRATIDVAVTTTSAPPPQARPDEARTTQGEPVVVSVLDNDVGEGLVVTAAGGSASLNAEVVDGGTAVRLIPDPSFFGTTAGSYTIRDVYDDPAREPTGRIELTVIGRPGTPSAPTVTADSREATLTWSSPPANGAPIEAYEVEHDQGDTLTLDPSSTYTWTSLTNGTAYRFRVRAVNEAGEGDWSPWSAPVVPNEVPGRPTAPTVTFGDGELEVTWQRPTNEGSPITGYVVEIGGATTGVRELPAGGGAEQSHTWTGLANGSNYTFRVKAVNAADEAGGDFSSWSDPEHPLTQPTAPPRPTLDNGPNYLDVSWSRPDDGGDAIQEYEIQIDSASGQTTGVSGANTTSYRWGNLTNGVDHTFRVRAWNRDSRGGQWSDFSAAGRACDVPSAPGAPSVTRGDQSIDVTWSAPAANGCEITGYELEVAAAGGASQTISAGAGATSTTVSGLTNGTSYTVRIRAANEQGDGAFSGPSGAVTPAGPPLATTIASVTASGVEELSVAWNAADDNGSAILRYEYRLNDGPAVSVGTATSITISSGLNAGTEYCVQVRAVNDVDAATWSTNVCRVAEGVPDTPTGLQVTNRTTSSLTWGWNAAASNGGGSVTYEVDPQGVSISSQGGRSYTLSGLGSNTTRDLRVRACNRQGCGSWTAKVAGTTLSPPRSVSIRHSSNNDTRYCDGATTCHPVQIRLQNFSPNTTYSYRCDWNDGTVVGPRTDMKPTNATLRTDGNGNFAYMDSWCHDAPGDIYSLQVTVNGVVSNTIN